MRAVVVDCSILIAFLLGEPEGDTLQEVIQACLEYEANLWAPALLPFELGNALLMADRRGRLPHQDREAIERDFFKLDIRLDAAPDSAVCSAIHRLAEKNSLTFYDASYLELSLRLRGPLWSLDRDLLALKDSFDNIFPRT